MWSDLFQGQNDKIWKNFDSRRRRSTAGDLPNNGRQTNADELGLPRLKDIARDCDIFQECKMKRKEKDLRTTKRFKKDKRWRYGCDQFVAEQSDLVSKKMEEAAGVNSCRLTGNWMAIKSIGNHNRTNARNFVHCTQKTRPIQVGPPGERGKRNDCEIDAKRGSHQIWSFSIRVIHTSFVVTLSGIKSNFILLYRENNRNYDWRLLRYSKVLKRLKNMVSHARKYDKMYGNWVDQVKCRWIKRFSY